MMGEDKRIMGSRLVDTDDNNVFVETESHIATKTRFALPIKMRVKSYLLAIVWMVRNVLGCWYVNCRNCIRLPLPFSQSDVKSYCF